MTPQPFNGPRLRRTPAAAFSFAALSISQARKKSRPILAFSPNCNLSQLFPQKTDKSDSRSLHFRYISPARTCHSPHLRKQKMPPFMNFITTVALSVQLIFLSHGAPHRCTLISYRVSISLSRSHLMRSIIFISHAPFCLISLPDLIRKLQMHVDFVQGFHIVVAQPLNTVDHFHKSCSLLFAFRPDFYPNLTDAR